MNVKSIKKTLLLMFGVTLFCADALGADSTAKPEDTPKVFEAPKNIVIVKKDVVKEVKELSKKLADNPEEPLTKIEKKEGGNGADRGRAILQTRTKTIRLKN